MDEARWGVAPGDVAIAPWADSLAVEGSRRRNFIKIESERHADGKLIMFLAIERVSKFTHVEFHDKAGKMAGSAFLRNVVEVFPQRERFSDRSEISGSDS